MFLTKEAVRLALPGHAVGTACDGCPPLAGLFEQYADGGGELLVCPLVPTWSAHQAALIANAKLAGATPMVEWIGDDDTTKLQRPALTERCRPRPGLVVEQLAKHEPYEEACSTYDIGYVATPPHTMSRTHPPAHAAAKDFFSEADHSHPRRRAMPRKTV